MQIKHRFSYWARILQNYLTGKSQISFWHEKPEVNANFTKDKLGEYYMTFRDKAGYKGPFDGKGIPMLDYGRKIGKQCNPIAISQYGLAHYNVFKKTGLKKNFEVFIKQADWLVKSLELNGFGVKVWMHHFDWDYFKKLENPWYSGLAQGQAISTLARAYSETKEIKYLEAANIAFDSLLKNIDNGGVSYVDKESNIWIEEYITNPPTHILNGFIWALWGVFDYYLLTGNNKAIDFYNACLKTIKKNLYRYDIGFWSLYDLAPTKIKPISSHFYHKLHVVQLKILYILTGDIFFNDYAKKWEKYQNNLLFNYISSIYKVIFKIFYY